MANIGIERKRAAGTGQRSSSSWLWIALALLALVLLAWWLWPQPEAVGETEPYDAALTGGVHVAWVTQVAPVVVPWHDEALASFQPPIG